MKLVFLVAFFSIASSLKDAPKLREDFTATVNVELHSYDGNLMFGSGMIVRDGKNRGFERSDLDSQLNLRLDRYDMDKTGIEYYFRGNKTGGHCSMINPNRTSLFPYWDWLSNASYIGIHSIEHKAMSLYESEVSGVRLILGVNPGNSSIPMFLERRSEFHDVIFTFNTFEKYDDDKDKGYFTIPDECT